MLSAQLVRDTIYQRLCCRSAAEHVDSCQQGQLRPGYFTWSQWTCRSSVALPSTGFENGRWISVTYVPIPQQRWFSFFKLLRKVRSQGFFLLMITTYYLWTLQTQAFSQIQNFIPNLPFTTVVECKPEFPVTHNCPATLHAATGLCWWSNCANPAANSQE